MNSNGTKCKKVVTHHLKHTEQIWKTEQINADGCVKQSATEWVKKLIGRGDIFHIDNNTGSSVNEVQSGVESF